MTATKEQNRSIRVNVNHWQNSRSVRIRPDQVGLQVTVPSCSHCVTCQSRVKQFRRTLEQKPTVIHQWKTLDDGACWLFLPRKAQQDPIDLLRKVLEVRIDGD